MFVSFLALNGIIVGIRLVGTYNEIIGTKSSLVYWCFFIAKIIPNVVLISIFFSLLFKLRKYHKFEYKRVKKHMFVFCAAEVSLFVLLEAS